MSDAETILRDGLDGHFYVLRQHNVSGTLDVVAVGRGRHMPPGFEVQMTAARLGGMNSAAQRRAKYGDNLEERIVALRNRLLSHREIAAELGCSQSLVARVLADRASHDG